MFCSLLLRVHPSQGVLLVWDQLRESREEAFPPYRDQSVTFWLILMNALPCYQRHLEGNYLSCSCCKLGAARSLWPDRHSHGGVKWESDSTVILGRSEEGLWNSHKNQDVFLAWTAKKENAKRKDNKFNFLFTNLFIFFFQKPTLKWQLVILKSACTGDMSYGKKWSTEQSGWKQWGISALVWRKRFVEEKTIITPLYSHSDRKGQPLLVSMVCASKEHSW